MDRVGAVGLVLVDQIVHVSAHQVPGVFVDVLLVHLLTKDGRPTARAAAENELEGRENDHREAPAADGLATHPGPKKARRDTVHERDEAADAGEAFDTRERRAANSACCPCRLRVLCVALLRFRCGSAGACSTEARTAACQNP